MAATQKSSKKRPATSQAGPTAKKANLAKSTDKGKGKEPSVKKRSRPITAPIEEDSVSEDAYEWDEGIEDDDMALDEDALTTLASDEMAVDAIPNAAPKDPNGEKSSHSSHILET